MKMIVTILLVVVALALAAAAYVRLAPVDVAAFHTAPTATEPGDTPTPASFTAARRITTQPDDILRAVESAATSLPRTQIVAGSIADNLVTFETRSKVMGFPDYTTATVTDTQPPLLVIHGRSRYGKGDMGVNKARVRAILSRLGPLIAPES